MAYTVCHAPSRIVSEMLPEIHTIKKFDFLKAITHYLII